jgi:hypothetical protein
MRILVTQNLANGLKAQELPRVGSLDLSACAIQPTSICGSLSSETCQICLRYSVTLANPDITAESAQFCIHLTYVIMTKCFIERLLRERWFVEVWYLASRWPHPPAAFSWRVQRQLKEKFGGMTFRPSFMIINMQDQMLLYLFCWSLPEHRERPVLLRICDYKTNWERNYIFSEDFTLKMENQRHATHMFRRNFPMGSPLWYQFLRTGWYISRTCNIRETKM